MINIMVSYVPSSHGWFNMDINPGRNILPK